MSTQISTRLSNTWPVTRPALQSDILTLDSQETAGQHERQQNEEMALSWSRILPEDIHTSSNTFVGSSLKISKILGIIRKENSDLVIGLTWPPPVITQHLLMYTAEWPYPQTEGYVVSVNSETEQVFTQVDVCKNDSDYWLAEHCTIPNSQQAMPMKNNAVHELVIGCRF